MKKILFSPWSTASIGVLAYCLTTWVALAPAKLLSSHVGHADFETVGSGPTPSWNFYSTELDQLLTEIRDKREALKTKEQQLNEFQARLESERQEILTVTQRVWQLQKALDRSVTEIKVSEQANLKRLAKMYATMAPEAASKVVQEMEMDQAVKVLATMKDVDSALLLENLAKDGGANAKRAALMMEKLRLIVSKGAEDKQEAR